MPSKKKLWFKGKSKAAYEGVYEDNRKGEREFKLYPVKGTAKSKTFDAPVNARQDGWKQK